MKTETPFDKLVYADTLLAMVGRSEVNALFACESGSRAWGFDSKDSDYDVRFLYHHNLDWYLSLAQRRDVIETKAEYKGIEVDAVGWDIRKFLGLVKKGNAMPFEWLFRCPVYLDTGEWLTLMRATALEYFSPLQMAYHYRGMATKHWHRYLEGRDEVTHKKYLYIMRALLNMEWYVHVACDHIDGLFPIDRIFAPATMSEMLENAALPDSVYSATWELLLEKMEGNELGLARPNKVLDDYISSEIERWKGGFFIGISGAPNWDKLDLMFKYTMEM